MWDVGEDCVHRGMLDADDVGVEEEARAEADLSVSSAVSSDMPFADAPFVCGGFAHGSVRVVRAED